LEALEIKSKNMTQPNKEQRAKSIYSSKHE